MLASGGRRRSPDPTTVAGAAAMYRLVETAKLNDIDPQAWLTDVLVRLQDHLAKRINEFLPWNWKRVRLENAVA